MNLTRYLVVTPARDEAAHIGRTLQSMAGQTVRPAQWVIVDDGSSDGTGALLDACAAQHAWVTVVHRPDRGRRVNGGGVMQAFHAGLAQAMVAGWDYIVKLDADLSFEPDYFERCFAAFEADPRLGIGGGTVCVMADDGAPRVESRGDPPFHVRGATKIYRRACWQAIAPLISAPGWDTLDEVKANRLGWHTRSFAELRLVQNKATGAADGAWANAFKNGRANYITGYHPAFMLAKCLRRAFRRPFGLNAAALAGGYLSGYLRRLPRAPEPEAIRYLRREQLRRLLLQPSIYG